ncbi:oxidoreductase [Falsigemmobacter faecalis]|uniref:Oxidoreductase n=1 Tax=Falsigemmobacter faecalis TaxID=2488730 RepID=A0A3P3DGQ4_9RHOB|nr:oxidoreductase [Falsigemmobacter faecalis]RRH73423.1 oxidoreductase [Falsigemmobacter faecalis]
MPELTRRSLILGMSLLPLPLHAAGGKSAEAAAALPHPEGDVILTVTGALPRRNSAEGAVFDRAMLKAMGEVEFTSGTPWSGQPQRFRGPSLHSLVTTLGLSDGNFTARAVNDYSIPVPVSEGVPGGPILAMEIDGQVLSLRERGPLWLIYPFDEVPAYRSEVSYIRSIWQLTRLEWQSPSAEGQAG